MHGSERRGVYKLDESTRFSERFRPRVLLVGTSTRRTDPEKRPLYSEIPEDDSRVEGVSPTSGEACSEGGRDSRRVCMNIASCSTTPYW